MAPTEGRAALPAFDHLMIRTGDCDAAAAILGRLGLTATPRSDFAGLRNRLVCFPPAIAGACAFLEFIDVAAPDMVPPPIQDLLPAASGPFAVTLAVADGRAAAGRLALSGHPAPVQDIARLWQLPSGEELQIELAVCIAPAASAPLRWVAAEHRTAGHYARADFTGHANGASSLLGAVAVAPEPADWGRRLGAAWGLPVRSAGRLHIVGAAGPTLQILPPDVALRRYPGLSIPPGGGLLGARLAVPDTGVLAALPPVPGLRRIAAEDERVVFALDDGGCVLSFERTVRH